MVTPQNCNFKGCGAFTGEMSVEQMKDLGITNVMIGHSERRGEFGIFKMDDDSTLATKLKYILDAGMTRSSHRSTRSLTPKRWCSPMNLSGPLVRVRLPHLKMHRQHTQASASSSLRRHLQRLRQVFAFSMLALPMQGMLRRFQQWKTLMVSLLGVPPLSLRSRKSWMPSLQRRRSETK